MRRDMNEYNALKELRKYLFENWDEPGCKLYFPNEAQTPGKYFCILAVLRADTEELMFGTSGNVVDRFNGIFSINFYGPTGQGTGILINLCEKMAGILGHRTIGGVIRCTSSQLTEVGIANEISKFVVNLSVNYRRDDTVDLLP